MARWTFGEFVLDLEARQLARAGTPVPLSPKAFQLLGVLVDGYGRALSKRELQDHLWPGTFVVEKNLTNLVSEIREALGDDPAQPRFIRTVHRFGYAFHDTPVADRGNHATGAAGTPATDVEHRRHNLPVALTAFIGRERELVELLRLVPSTRLLTLTGAGGCGKTRLALEVATKVLDRFPDGVWFVDLAALTDPDLVTQAVASVLDIREGGKPLRDALSDFVRPRQILFILDNCEHLIAACAQLADALLRGAEHACILATSREGLGLTGETVWRVPSLSLPDPLQAASVETLAACDAVRLFVARAGDVDPGFTVTAANAAAIASICARLDGIPLALELAAARVKVLSIEQIEARLNDRFRLLTGGSRTAGARQRTLEATVDWSYDLLSDAERRLLRRLSVFAGGWTIDAAEEVTSDDPRERDDLLDVLSRLVDKSLVNADSDGDGNRRYHCLETVRQYARERLVESGEAERLRDRHLDCFHALARTAEPELTRAEQASWLLRLQQEHDNLRLALDWCLAGPKRGQESLELATAMWFFWLKRGYLGEGQDRLERALSAAPAAPASLRAKALMSLGALAFFRGDLDRARALMQESVSLARPAGELSMVAFSLGIMALAELERGDLAACVRLAVEGQAAARAGTAPVAGGPSLAGLAYVAMHEGDFDRAARLHEEVLAICRSQGETWGLGIVLFDLALLRVVQERHEEARALGAEGLALYRASGDRLGIAWCLGVLAAVEAASGRVLRAARLRGAMEGLHDSVGAPVQASFNIWIGDRYLEVMKASLGEDAFQAAMAEGRALPLSRAIQLGLEATAG